MQLKLTTDYAIRIIVYLAWTKKITSSTEMAQAMSIPHKYLSKIVFDLKKAGFVTTHSGTYGGYSLAKKPDEISLFDIMNVTEGKMKINRCLEEDRHCTRKAAETCPVRKEYTILQNEIEEFLKSRTIDKFVE